MIDKTDRKILCELDKNSRKPYVAIAKTLQMAPETLRYRIRRLINTGVIQNLIPVIDGGKLGFYYYKIFFKLHNVSEANVEKIVQDLCEDPNINWVVRVDGPYDIGFTVKVQNPIELSELTGQIRGKYNRYIHSWKYSVNIRMDFLGRGYLKGAKTQKLQKGTYTAATAPYKLDSTGWSIIDSLAQDPRMSASDIAKGLSIGEDAVLLRIKQLERDGVIVRYTMVLDNEKINQFNFYILIFLNAVTQKKEQEFADYCKTKACIPYVIKSLGEWDYEISVEVSSVQEYRELMMDLTKRYSELIREYKGMNVARIYKYVYP